MSEEEFQKELTELINKHSMENASNTPDWLLAQYLSGCLAIFTTAIQQRESWYGHDPRPSEPFTTVSPVRRESVTA